MDALDGNAIAGLLHRGLRRRDDRRDRHLRHVRRQRAGGRTRRLPAGSGHRRALPHLRQRPHGAGQARGVTCVDLAGLASLSQTGPVLSQQAG